MIAVRMFALSLCLHRGTDATNPDMEFVARTNLFKQQLLTSKECSFWRAVFKISEGKGSRTDSCESEILRQALTVSESSVVGLSWVTRNSRQLGESAASDLLAGLTAAPFWLDQGGRFDLGGGELNHWGEAEQIAWLVGGYFIGEAFQSDNNRSDIIFNGIDHTGLILNMEAKRRLWRWLDHKQRFGLTRLDPKALEALLTLAALAKDVKLKELAKMVLHLQIFELQNSYWKGKFLSPKVDPAWTEELEGLLFLLNGVGNSSSFTGPSIVLLTCLGRGLQVPKTLLGSGYRNSFTEEGTEFWESYGVSATSPSDPPGLSSPEDCIFWFGQDGLHSALRCYLQVGRDYRLWGRHPRWDPRANLASAMLSRLTRADVFKVERLAESFSGVRGRRTVHRFLTDAFALTSEASDSSGKLSADCVRRPWRLHLPRRDDDDGGGGGDLTGGLDLRLPGDRCVAVLPRVAQYRSTVISIDNPDLMLSVVLNTGETAAIFNVDFDKTYTRHAHWFVGQVGEVLVALYSHRAMRWDTVEKDKRAGQTFRVRHLSSHNLWICHVETGGSFEGFVERTLNSALHIQEVFPDDFSRCLFSRRCLDGGPARLLSCLRDPCPVKRHVARSPLAACLLDVAAGATPTEGEKDAFADLPVHMESGWIRYLQVAECLTAPLMEVEMKWQMGDVAVHFGTEQDLRVWENSVEVDLNSTLQGVRYKTPLNSVDEAAKTFRLVTPDGRREASFDFDNIRFREN